PPLGSVSAASFVGSDLVTKAIPDSLQPTSGRFWLFDVDGDGTVETVRDVWGGSDYNLTAVSPVMYTLSGTQHVPALYPSPRRLPTQLGSPPDGKVWLLDANGDGLTDLAWMAPS